MWLSWCMWLIIQFFMDEDIIKELKRAIKTINERLTAIETEQRRIREDILSGTPKERMQRRLLENPEDKIKKRKLDDFKIEI